MKTQSTFLYVLRLAATLLIITALVAAALAGVNAITKEAIAANQARKTQQALAIVLPEVSQLEKMELIGDTGMVNAVYVSGDSYAVEVAPNGFAGAVTMMVGIHAGKVTGISIINHGETPSLGAEAAAKNAKGESFRSQFVGQSGTLAVGDQIDALSGATITSKAVTDGVNAALEFVKTLG